MTDEAGRAAGQEQASSAEAILEHLDKQLVEANIAGVAPGLSEAQWRQLATTIFGEVSGLGEATTNQLRSTSPIALERYREEMVSFQVWMELAGQNKHNPFVVRAQVITELYVAFVWLRDSVLKPVAKAVNDGQSATHTIVSFLSTGEVNHLRNAFAHGRWCYTDDFSGLQCWYSNREHFTVTQENLDAWQLLSRGTSVAILLALTDT